ncbi:MAG: hypothetical protein NC938_06780 [Candidatus Omnitrophica bacterium]|nr:hypothetical protein [Candidatus Omnitrophota bacterium]MCM8791378.1 hypothetical protein [Candidatus Omnitrophota bacterium]
MAEELKGLIAKIQEEGIKAAQAKAEQIEEEARRRAEEKIQQAEKEARRILSEAAEKAAKIEASARESLKQASRDILISLKKEIAAMLDRIITLHIHKTLSPEELAGMLIAMIKGCSPHSREKVVISLRKEDLEKVEKTLFAELGAEAKKGITLKSSSGIRSGFTISYDGGKSYFDFTEKALAEYLSSQLSPYLAEILKESV